jgi:hypothetical protein
VLGRGRLVSLVVAVHDADVHTGDVQAVEHFEDGLRLGEDVDVRVDASEGHRRKGSFLTRGRTRQHEDQGRHAHRRLHVPPSVVL